MKIMIMMINYFDNIDDYDDCGDDNNNSDDDCDMLMIQMTGLNHHHCGHGNLMI